MLCGSPEDTTSGFDAGRVSIYTLGCMGGAVYSYCDAATNTTGSAARMHWQNTTSIAANNFRLYSAEVPPNQFGLFFYGGSEDYVPFGEGKLCIGGPFFRLGVVNSGAAGQPSKQVDFTTPPGLFRSDLCEREVVLLALVPRPERWPGELQLRRRSARDLLPLRSRGPGQR